MLLNRIELFVIAAKHQSLGKTARVLHVSASSVCQRLKLLEDDLGAKLYRKNNIGIELTDAGRTVLTIAGQILRQIELLKTVSTVPVPRLQSLTIGGTHTPSAKYLPAAIAAFQRKHPDTKVTFLTADRARIEKLLRDSEIDIALIQSPSESSDFHAEHFAVSNLVLFTHPAHPLAKKKHLDLKDLAKSPLIVRDGRGASEKMFKQLRSQGLTLNIMLRCGSPDAVKAAVRKKMGVGILFQDLIQEDINRKDLKIIKFSGLPKFIGHSYIVYRKKTALSLPAFKFLTLLRVENTRHKSSASIAELAEIKSSSL